jgi:DNA helicase-2/ATP-dependent DNA helicase PcrA
MNAAVQQIERVWSSYQTAIFTFLADTTRNLVVRAGAGSGKTTLLVEIVKRLAGLTIFLAFNKSIQLELESRGVFAKTFHGLVYSAVTRFYSNMSRASVDANKVRNLIRERYSDADQRTYGSFVAKLVGLAKNSGMGFLMDDTEQNWDALAAKHDLEIEDAKGDHATALELARSMLITSNEVARTNGLLDFDDLLFLAVKEGIKLPTFDNVLVDEAQDTNAIQRAIIRKIMHDNSRLVAVGDPSQGIYGFRGADSDAMDLIKSEFDAEELPLTVSYRCATSIVKYASQFGVIEAAPGAIEGSVTRMNYAHDLPIAGKAGSKITRAMQPQDLVICRLTKPLVELAYDLMMARKPAYMMGREIGEGLVNLIKKQQAKGVLNLIAKLDESTSREIERAKAKGDDAKAERAEDRRDCIMFLIDTLPENERTIPELIRIIENLFKNKADAVVLATVHKAKGLESNRVFWLNHDYVSKWARQPWQKQQEVNLRYVAATRAKSELVLIPSPQKGAS